MKSLQEVIIYFIVACSFIMAVAAVISGSITGEVAFLNVLMSSVIISLLASILYVLEGMETLKRR